MGLQKRLEEMVMILLRDKDPNLLKELNGAGTLQEFVEETAEATMEAMDDLEAQMRPEQLPDDMLERAGRLGALRRSAEESAISQMVEALTPTPDC